MSSQTIGITRYAWNSRNSKEGFEGFIKMIQYNIMVPFSLRKIGQ